MSTKQVFMNTILEGTDEDSGSSTKSRQKRVFLVPQTTNYNYQHDNDIPESIRKQSTHNIIYRNPGISPNYHRRRSSLGSDSYNTYDGSSEESVETMMSSDLYSLQNYAPKDDNWKFSDYLVCHNLVEEVKGTLEDAANALDHIWNVFTITQEDLDAFDATLLGARIELEEKALESALIEH